VSGLLNQRPTPKEIDILCIITHVLLTNGTNKITPYIKKSVMVVAECNFQVLTNYISRLKKKGAIKEDNTIHPLLTSEGVKIVYEKERGL
jgi:predicted transcriptional regulator